MILAIDTSCDETSAAITDGRRVLSNVISSQIDIHKKYGGVYPALAKRAHQERIDFVIKEALKRSSTILYHPLPSSNSLKESKGLLKDIKAVAVTYGPGLAIALEVGIKMAKEICENPLVIRENHRIPLIAINHLEGHIYSCLAQNSRGVPEREIAFPALCLIVSGGHTEIVLMKDHGVYEVIGATLDDACGEALDKAAKILHLGYPGGPIIEQLAEQGHICANPLVIRENHKFHFNPPLREKSNLDFSYSGLKTQLLYLVQKMSEDELGKNLYHLAASFQEACFEQIIRKVTRAIKIHQPKTIICGGGVIANKYLRKLMRRVAKENNLPVLFPPYKNLTGDNAAMIGVAAHYKYPRGEFVKNPEMLDREPRLRLDSRGF